MLIHIL
jgi:hypothetical protein